MLRPEPFDIIMVVLIALLVVGANRLPETARAIGQTIREFKDALAERDSTSEKPLAEKET